MSDGRGMSASGAMVAYLFQGARMTRTALAAFALTLALPSAAAEDTYTIDPVHSQPIFEVRHMGFSIQRGSFTKASGSITLDRAAKKGSIGGPIDATSIKTIDPRL